MSVEALSWALDQRVGDSTRKCILMVLADVADAKGESWYGQKKLAEMAECSVRTLRRHIAQLQEDGYVELMDRSRKDGSRTTNLYRLNLVRNTPGQSVPPSGQNDRTDYPPGQNDRSSGHERPVPRSPVSGGTEPSLNRKQPTSSSLRSSDEPKPPGSGVENSEEGGNSLTWGDFAAWMRTTGCPECLWRQEGPPAGPKGSGDPWSVARDLSIAKQLHEEGEPLDLIRDVVEAVPELVSMEPPLRMTIFWAEGRRSLWNQVKGEVLKRQSLEAAGKATGPQKIQIELQATGTDG